MMGIVSLRWKNKSILNLDECEIYESKDNSPGIHPEILRIQALLHHFLAYYYPIEIIILTNANHIISTYKHSIILFFCEIISRIKAGKCQKFNRRLRIVVAIGLAYQSTNG
jgi:hypothetical protein